MRVMAVRGVESDLVAVVDRAVAVRRRVESKSEKVEEEEV
jgi:hypothetical protein